MKYYIFLFCISFTSFLNAQTTKKALFLGNSYTAYNNLPNLTSQIANSFGDVLIYDSNTPGGYTFNGHSTNSTSIAKINSQNWDYVILQEQSQLPSFSPAQVTNDVIPYADSLNRIIKENDSCTTTLFYMTWGRKNGDASNCAFYPPVCTYAGMQERLYDSYVLMANQFNAEVSPVGAAWRKLRADFPLIDLYAADESHPSLYGSYLAACTFYATIFHKSPVGAYIPTGISAADANAIQTTVASVVFDSLDTWRIDTTNFIANFTYNVGTGLTHNFIPSYLYGNTYYWNFGDGNFDTTFNSNQVSHSYPGPGTYNVELIVEGNCNIDTFSVSLNVVSNSIEQNNSSNHIKIFPNPTNSFININNAIHTKAVLLSITGEKIIEITIPSNNYLLQLNNTPSGQYLLQIISSDQIQNEILVILN